VRSWLHSWLGGAGLQLGSLLCTRRPACSGSPPSAAPRLTSGPALGFALLPQVREPTLEGCLCMPTWNKPGGGKKYSGTCADPDGSSSRWCIVDVNTCPQDINTNRGTCADVKPQVRARPGAAAHRARAPARLGLEGRRVPQRRPAPAAPAHPLLPPPRPRPRLQVYVPQNTTHHGCKCVAGRWPYFFDASSYVLLSGCANPDQDIQGSWCPIDPSSCGRNSGSFRSNGSMVVFDYCLDQVAPYSYRCEAAAAAAGAAGDTGAADAVAAGAATSGRWPRGGQQSNQHGCRRPAPGLSRLAPAAGPTGCRPRRRC
jgi:hypothetical protein